MEKLVVVAMEGSHVKGGRIRSVLGKSRRRFALYYLLSNEHTDIDSLSVQIAAWEQGESATSVDEKTHRRVQISLHHNHLPQLAAHDIVEYDVRSGDVVRSDGFDDVRPAIQRLRATDERRERKRGSRESSVGERDGEQLPSNR